MKRVAMIFGLTAAFCGVPGFALDIDPASRLKAVSAARAAVPTVAPAPVHNPLPDLPNGMDVNGRGLSGACATNTSDLCYDYKENRLIYRPSRNWMPEIAGLRPEHISVRRDSLVFRYSFR